MQEKIIKVLLLLALPASGKSEIRAYLDSVSLERRIAHFRIGKIKHLDDYPYVEFMRETDKVAQSIHFDDIFFNGKNGQFKDPYEWLTLIELLNEDYFDLINKQIDCIQGSTQTLTSYAMQLFRRINMAQQRAGACQKLEIIPIDVLDVMANRLKESASKVERMRDLLLSDELTDEHTLIVEFSRGGAHEAKMPLYSPFGYQHSLRQICPQILEKASILYVYVTPEESRKKNFERAIPPAGSNNTTLFHGVPTLVMLNDYGCDDMMYLKDNSNCYDVLKIFAHGCDYELPFAEFDNNVDKTSFARAPVISWKSEDTLPLHTELARAMDQIYQNLNDGVRRFSV